MPPISFICSRPSRSRPTGAGLSWRRSIPSCSGTGGSRGRTSWPRRTARCDSGKDGVRAVTASQHLEAHAPGTALQLAEGSWGANGDHSMWLNDRTAWTWERLWRLEDVFWDAAPAGLASPAAHPELAQAARELLLAQ